MKKFVVLFLILCTSVCAQLDAEDIEKAVRFENGAFVVPSQINGVNIPIGAITRAVAETEAEIIEKIEDQRNPEKIISIADKAILNEVEEDLACMRVSKDGLETRVTPVDDKLAIPDGYKGITEAFNLQCNGNKVTAVFKIPSNAVDVHALKCEQEQCGLSKVEKVEKLLCGDTIVEEVRSTEFLVPEMFPIKLKEVKLRPVVESSGYKVKPLESATISVRAPVEQVREPANKNLKIMNTPIFVSMNKAVEVNITMPFVALPKIDRNSIRPYAFKDGAWVPIEGELFLDGKTITVTVDMDEYATNNQALFALIGQYCRSCQQPGFFSLFRPIEASRTAVVLVHGFGSSAARFNDLVNDIRFGRQPYQVWAFNYPSSRNNLDNAVDLANSLELNSNQFDNIYIIAHSSGAIIAQMALQHASENGMAVVDKVDKAVLVATPNDQVAGNQMFDNLFRYYVNYKTDASLFDLDSPGMQNLLGDHNIPRVPGIDYYVIAGTKTYDFNSGFFGVQETNDGLVTVSSAQHVGGVYTNKLCEDYWEVHETHTDLLKNDVSVDLMEEVIGEGASFDKYYELVIENCNPNDKYVIVGKFIDEEKVSDETGCSCGNGWCGVDENKANCAEDCDTFFRKENTWLIILLFAVFIGIVFVIYIVYRSTRGMSLDRTIEKGKKAIHKGKHAEAVRLYREAEYQYEGLEDKSEFDARMAEFKGIIDLIYKKEHEVKICPTSKKAHVKQLFLRLKDFILRQRQKGVKDKQIEAKLKKSGWKEKDYKEFLKK